MENAPGPDAGAGTAPDHVPVMIEEVLALLRPRPGQTFLDGTAGAGGHAAALLERLRPGGRLWLLDRDPEAIERLKARFGRSPDVLYDHADFRDFDKVLEAQNAGWIDGALVDLGLSSRQLASDRGFSFERPDPLDMRFDTGQALTAAQIVNQWDAKRLADWFSQRTDQPYAGRIARAIVANRPISRADRLAEIVRRAQPATYRRRKRVHPATRVFLALRMAVNDELGSLDAFCRTIFGRLKPGGRVAVIAFHSGEDRVVKQRFREAARAGVADLVTRKPVTPTAEEIRANPRSRSAKLRVAQKRCAGPNAGQVRSGPADAAVEAG